MELQNIIGLAELGFLIGIFFKLNNLSIVVAVLQQRVETLEKKD